jgi:hypothetical protein
LSAYNIFFKEERARILEEIPTRRMKDLLKGGKQGRRTRRHGEKEEQASVDGSSLFMLANSRKVDLKSHKVIGQR